jgi:hypothetical protein
LLLLVLVVTRESGRGRLPPLEVEELAVGGMAGLMCL